MPEHDVPCADPEILHHLFHGGKAQAGAGARIAARPLPSPDQPPGAVGRRSHSRRLDRPVDQAVDRRQRRLVLGGARVAVAGQPAHALDKRPRAAFEGLGVRVAVEIVAVGRVHVLPQPHARICQLDRALAQGAGHRLERVARPHLVALLEPELPVAAQRILREPVIVVPRHDRERPPAERPAERLEERQRAPQRSGQRRVAQLDRIAEQDHLVRLRETVEQPRLDLRPPQQIRTAVDAQVEVRDHRGQHAPKSRARGDSGLRLCPLTVQSRPFRRTSLARRFRTDRDTATGRLLHAYRDGGDDRARSRLVELYMPLVEALAVRHERHGGEHDDLVQAGSIGLLNAIERFDTKRGDEFVAFAVPTIAGEMKRHLRDRSSTVRLPRRLHETSMRLPSTREELTTRLGRPPTANELAAELGVTHQDLARLQTAIARPADAAEQAGPAEGDASDARVALSGAFRTLDDTDRQILYLRFVEERSRREVATQLGISQSALARRADAALAKLRAELEGRAFEEAPAASALPGAPGPPGQVVRLGSATAEP